jgi:CotS family spore coat protein
LPQINQEPLMEVLSNYNLEVLEITNENYKEKKGVWWIKTPEGEKILKKLSFSEQSLKFILSAVDHLTQNGVLIPKIIKTTSGSDYVIINDVCYTLSEAISGRNPSYDSNMEFAAVVKGLANFHKASFGYKIPQDSKPKEHLGLWVEDYTRQLECMFEFYNNEIQSNRNTPVGNLIIKEFPYFYEKGQRAINALKGKEYKNWVESIRVKGCLCHQDFAAGNLILNSSGLYVLDTDSITFDIPARDIRKLFNKIMKKPGKADVELAKKYFNLYQSENPLTPSEWQVVRYDLMFPHLFIGSMSKYYYQREKTFTSEKYLEKIHETAEIERSMTSVFGDYNAIMQSIIIN